MYKKKDDILKHHGVLGMRWGVRRGRNASSSGRVVSRFRKRAVPQTVDPKYIQQLERKKRTAINEHEREQKFIDEYKHRDKMSTKQIQARTNRLKAEQEFKKQVYADQNAREKAAKDIAAAKSAKNKQRLKVALAVVGALDLSTMVKDPNAANYPDPKKLKEAQDGVEALRNSLKTLSTISKAVSSNLDVDKQAIKNLNQNGVTMNDKDTLLHMATENDLDDVLMHGGKWSEEAKERVRQARQAKRRVSEMFASLYNKTGKFVNKNANKLANKTIYKKQYANAKTKLNNANRLAQRKVNTSMGSNQYRYGTLHKLNRELKANKRAFKKATTHKTSRIVKDAAKITTKRVRKAADDAFYTKKERKADQKKLRSAKKRQSKDRKDMRPSVKNAFGFVKDKITGQKTARQRYAKATVDKGKVLNKIAKSESKDIRTKATKKINSGLRKLDSLYTSKAERKQAEDYKRKVKSAGKKAAEKAGKDYDKIGNKAKRYVKAVLEQKPVESKKSVQNRAKKDAIADAEKKYAYIDESPTVESIMESLRRKSKKKKDKKKPTKKNKT